VLLGRHPLPLTHQRAHCLNQFLARLCWFGDPYAAARNGWLDDVIAPAQTRKKLIQALRPLMSKREWVPPKKHGNIPL
jgi:acetyl-CoA carboxylase carboxyltransferase component